MARAIEQIERDLAALSKAVNGLAAEFSKAYIRYLEILGQAMCQQLMQAIYQICTQAYPKQFLSLSFNQRQQLQQTIRKLSQNAAAQLLVQLKNTGDRRQEAEDKGDEGDKEDLEDRELGDYELQHFPSLYGEKELPLGNTNGLPSNFFEPLELAKWQHKQEEAIAHTLKTLSLETNRLLQQVGILPQKLPTPLLEAATTASEVAAEMTSGPPNILNLLIETENHSETEDGITQLITVQLRLSEIEFSDVNVRTVRNQIRQLEAKLNSLGQEYQKKQRERLVAEAEAAWRVSWFED